MSEFKKYFSARTHVYMRPYEPGEEVRWVDKVHVSPRDGATGSPKAGDYIAYTAEKPDQHFLVSAENYKSYEATGEGENPPQAEEKLGEGPMVRDPLAAAEAERERKAEEEAEAKKKTDASKSEAPKTEPKKEAPKFPTKS